MTHHTTNIDTCGRCSAPVSLKPLDIQRHYAKAYHSEKYTCAKCGHASVSVARLQGAWPK